MINRFNKMLQTRTYAVPRMLLVAMLLVMIASCDRFEHTFKPDVAMDFDAVLFTPLQQGFDQITPTDLGPAMAFYADDYQHFGVNKSDWETQLRSYITGVVNPEITVTMQTVSVQSDTNALANWRLTISNPDSKAVIADSLYIGERLIKQNGTWLLRGNQMTCNPPDKQLVIAEYFTYRTCDNCPPAEVKLQQLKSQYPGRFTYLEHHINNELYLPHNTTHIYYQAYSAPVAVFQGTRKVTQSTDTQLDLYQSHVDEMVQVNTPMKYQMISSVLSGNELSASVKLTPQMQLDQSDMVLNYVIIEEISSYTNADGQPLHNVVRALGSMPLNGVDLAEPVSFNLTSTVELPEDIHLVVFAQRRTPSPPFQNNATIYSGIEVPLTR